MRMHLVWLSLALVACVRQSTYDQAVAENHLLRQGLEIAQRDEQKADVEVSTLRREKAEVETALAELRRAWLDETGQDMPVTIRHRIILHGEP